MSDWYLYLIRCGDGSLYTGITTDIDNRLDKHKNNRGAKYLRGRGPIELAWSSYIGERGLALKLEYRIKKLNKNEKLALIDGTIQLRELMPDTNPNTHATKE
jgi:putative endonuclease